MSDSLLPLAVATLDRTALALIVGAAAVRLYIYPSQHLPGQGIAAPPLLAPTLALFAVSSLGDLVMRTAALADVPPAAAWSYLGRVLTYSEYGLFWWLRAAVWLVLIALLPLLRRERHVAADWGLAAGAATLVFVASSTGHGGNEGSLTLPNLINSLHLAGAGLWGGTVVVYVASILPRLRRGAAPALAQTATRLSTLAGMALAAVLATGVYNAWRQLGEWHALWTTDYGRALLVKLAAVGVMMAIGAANRFLLVPAIVRRAGQTPQDGAGRPALRFLRLLRLDVALFVFVLVCAAVLGSQAPPAHLTGDDMAALASGGAG